jgi:hypothetical protein
LERTATPWRTHAVRLAGAAATACLVAAAAWAPLPAGSAPRPDPPVAGSGGFAGQRPIAVPHVSASDPLRVTVFGDSVPYVAEPGIAAALDATGEVAVTDGAFPGFGLSNDPTWATPRTGIASLVAGDHTQLVLATWSWDNVCTAADRARGDVCALTDPAGFRAELEQVVRLMLGPGGADGVIFLEFPPTGPDAAVGEAAGDPALAQKAAGEAAFNRTIRALPAAFPGKVMYLPVATSVLDHGRFTYWLPPATRPRAPEGDWARVRMTDGVHLCPAGAARYASAILADLTTLYHLPPAAPTWQHGSWVDDPRFSAGPGSCPDDHPPR